MNIDSHSLLSGTRARKPYVNEPLGIDLDNTAYALDSSTIDLCRSVFDWAPFRSTMAAVWLHTLLDRATRSRVYPCQRCAYN